MESALGLAVSIINAMSAQGVWGFASQQSSEKARYWGSQTLTHSALSHPKGHKNLIWPLELQCRERAKPGLPVLRRKEVDSHREKMTEVTGMFL